MTRFETVFKRSKPVIAMVHLQPLIGTPAYQGSVPAVLDAALTEAELYLRAGVDALMIENMHDLPYLNREVGPEIVAQMGIVAMQHEG